MKLVLTELRRCTSVNAQGNALKIKRGNLLSNAGARYVSAALRIDVLPLKHKKAQLKKLLLCLATVFLALGAFVTISDENKLYLAALDVGQGDALLLRDARSTILVDTGNQDALLKRCLARQGIYHLDAVFITHPDDDHCGSLSALMSVVKVDKVYVPSDLIECSCAKCAAVRKVAACKSATLVGVHVGDVFVTRRFRMEVVWPYEYSEGGGNQDSLCLNVSVDVDKDKLPDYSALLVGDAESGTLERLADSNSLESVDIFKVGHHGSAVSCNREILEKINPRIALLSVGEHNRYGHPTATTLSLLENQGSKIARTDKQGTIMCSFRNDGIRITTDR